MGVLDFQLDYILEDDEVKLVPLAETHIKELRDISREEKLWTYFLGKSNGNGRFPDYVREAIMQRAAKKEYPFAVYDKVKKQFAGSTRFFDYSKELNVIRLGHTWYGSDFRGTGLNNHCKYLLFEFAFEKLGVERIGLGAHAENIVSIAAMKKVGCVQEGTIRNLFPSIDGTGRANAELFGVLNEEWLDRIKLDLKRRL
ncbi:MAG: GNAT family N-acetyltransferase [Muriicola sp.]|nr:GNAT family N-acetyltransferase [Muriicola sp.]NNK10224.1 GNAT family N-acetyltransferase [Flavobacteriaceae bacterium]